MKLIINNSKYPEFCEFPIAKIEASVMPQKSKQEYIENLRKEYPNLENYNIIELYLEKNYTEDMYYNLVGYFTLDKMKIAKIKFGNNKELIMNFDIMAKIYRSDIPGKSKISFIYFKLKEEL